jgi:carbon storage regulator
MDAAHYTPIFPPQQPSLATVAPLKGAITSICLCMLSYGQKSKLKIIRLCFPLISKQPNNMLVLSRHVGETIMIADNIEIMVTRIEGDTVRLRIGAPRDIPIFRGELYREIKRLKERQGGAPTR